MTEQQKSGTAFPRLSPPAYKIIRAIFEANKTLEQPELEEGPKFEACLDVVYERKSTQMLHGWLNDWSAVSEGAPFAPSIIQELIDQGLIQEVSRHPGGPGLEAACYVLTSKCRAGLTKKLHPAGADSCERNETKEQTHES